MGKILILIFTILLILVGCNNTNIIEPNELEDETVTIENNEANENTENEINSDTDENNEDESSKDEKQIAPDFELESLDGTMVKLSELKGKNVIINFWATWCGYCVLEMPDLQKLNDKYKDEDLIVLAVNVGETKETVQEFMEENELNLNILLDKDSSVANNYGLRSFPSTLTVDKEGNILTGYIGMMTYDLMEKLYGYFNQE
jgi:peroxiredoxin